MRGAMERALQHDSEQRQNTISEIIEKPHQFSVGDIQSAMKHLAEIEARQRSLLRRVLPILMSQLSEKLYGDPWATGLDVRLPLESRIVHNIAVALREIPTSQFPSQWRQYPSHADCVDK